MYQQPNEDAGAPAAPAALAGQAIRLHRVTLTLPGDVRLELSAYYTSPSLAGINIFRTYCTVDAGLKKTFLAKKLDARLTG